MYVVRTFPYKAVPILYPSPQSSLYTPFSHLYISSSRDWDFPQGFGQKEAVLQFSPPFLRESAHLISTMHGRLLNQI